METVQAIWKGMEDPLKKKSLIQEEDLVKKTEIAVEILWLKSFENETEKDAAQDLMLRFQVDFLKLEQRNLTTKRMELKMKVL